MVFKKYIESLFTLVFLLITFVALAATSTGNHYLQDGLYRISSDCVDPVVDQSEVTVTDYVVTSPASVSFTDFGFPVADLTDRDSLVGAVGTVSRTCTLSYGGTFNNYEAFVFTCKDDGEYSCTIVLEEN